MALGRLALALLGVLAYQNREKIGTWLGNATQSAGTPNDDLASDSSGTSAGGGIFDTISKTFGDSGLSEVLDRFRNAGSGDKVDSWVKDGPSEGIEPHQVAAAVDEATLSSLSQQTGLSREELLRRLALELPSAVDRMTPDGKLPEGGLASSREPTLLDDVPPSP
jgi:uncharacterized protein YidB (DUF937 family)